MLSFYVNIGFPKTMLTVLLSTLVLSTSVNNRCWKSLITDVKTLFSSSVTNLHKNNNIIILPNRIKYIVLITNSAFSLHTKSFRCLGGELFLLGLSFLDLSISASTSYRSLVSTVSFPSPLSNTLSSRWYVSFNSDQISHEVSSSSRLAHCTRTILFGFGVEWSHCSEMMAKGEITGWLSTIVGGRDIGSIVTVDGWWNGLRIEQWKIGWIREFSGNCSL